MESTDTHTTSGGSKATDFQPQTGNPQSNVGGGLQPVEGGMQPSTTNNGTNVFEQPGINPQAFPQTGSLQVIDTTSPGLSSGSTAVESSGLNAPALILIFLGFCIVSWVFYKLRFTSAETTHAKPSQEATTSNSASATKTPKPKKKKPHKKKKNSKKRK